MINTWVPAWHAGAVALLVACGPAAGLDAGVPDGSPASRDASVDAGPVCQRDRDCDDSVFCNGAERCVPGDPGAFANGCIPGTAPCADGSLCVEASDQCELCTEDNRDQDGDGDWSTACGGEDCDDTNPNVRSGIPEVCDPLGVNEDCNLETFGPPGPTGVHGDADGDSFVSAGCCQLQPGGALLCGTDCNDANGEINPDATEVCNGLDDNCDGMLDPTIEDRDGDGWAGCADLPADLRDCDDASTSAYPGAPELCDGVDNDCDGSAAGEDLDGDSFLAVGATCAGGPRDALPRTDCDDGDASVSPAATELCDAIDQDCDGDTAEAPASASCPSDAVTTYACVAEACAVASCATTHDDCNELEGDGCEQALNLRDHCGACGNACEWTCAAGPSCDDPVALTAGAFHVCARTSGGRIRCWGRNDDGQIGNGGLSTTPSTRPDAYVLAQTGAGVVPLTTVQEVESGAYFNCARMASRNLYCWGRNDHGQLGDGVAGPATGIARAHIAMVDAVAIGETHVCAIRSGPTFAPGEVWCWGDDRHAQCNGGAVSSALAPRRVWASTPAVQVVAGTQHSCLLTSAGEVHCWGGNAFGQVGDGTTDSPRNLFSPVRAPTGTGSLAGIVEIAAGAAMTCARTATNATYCWGAGASRPQRVQTTNTNTIPVDFTSFVGEGNLFGPAVYGQTDGGVRAIGRGTGVFHVSPAFPELVGGSDITGSQGTVDEPNVILCAIHEPGLQCAGVNTYGEVGDGTRSPRTTAPTDVLPPL